MKKINRKAIVLIIISLIINLQCDDETLDIYESFEGDNKMRIENYTDDEITYLSIGDTTWNNIPAGRITDYMGIVDVYSKALEVRIAGDTFLYDNIFIERIDKDNYKPTLKIKIHKNRKDGSKGFMLDIETKDKGTEE